ncbi:MAG TPA: hypothetical protein DCZ94_13270 [Lentisphaeria bacterium]|nr:MAG: hypothetical protein A2X48_24400 [Lentisphaerae bacterium GWF2_49_21]HBC87918.1 hypothetical protein [Lentisphaeria bacterium]
MKPNIIFILSDQHNAKVLGHKKHPDVKTPNLDRLAAEGVRFDNAITQNPICTPSRTCFLSGQYAHNHGIYMLSGPQPNNLPNMLGTFRKAGYQTAAIGKIHCPEYWVEDQSDTFIETAPGCSINGAPEYLAHIRKQGLVEEHKISESRGGPFGQSLDGYQSPLPYRDTPEGYIVTKSIEFMNEAQEKGKPFIAHVSFPRPHQTYAPTEEFWNLYDENELTMPPNWQYERNHKAPNLKSTVKTQIEMAEKWTLSEPHTYEAGCRRKMRGYLGCISMMDHAVGEIMEYLKEKGIDDNTIIVYSSDHGDYACEHGLIEKAPGICSDAITRIPFIWRVPGVTKAGLVADELVETVDVYPTICSLAGLEHPQTSDGKDITPLLKGEKQELHKVAVTEFAWSKSIRKGSWRYVYYPREMYADEYPEGFGELYNLEDDPWEMNNLYFDENQKGKLAELERDLMDWLVTTTRIVGANSSVKPSGDQAVTRFKVTTNVDGKVGYDYIKNTPNKNYL